MTLPDPDIVRFLERIGHQKNPEVNREVAMFYAQKPYEEPSGLTVVTDISFGEHPRQALDLFVPAPPDGPARPVVIFVHGGGFVGGARALPGTPFYGNVGRFYANCGFLAVIAGYRLAPDAVWPDACADIAAVIDWVRDHIAGYGGDPAAIVLHGHSAGGAHVADYLHDRKRSKDGLVGAILQSAIVDLDLYGEPTVAGIDAYYGNPGSHRELDPLPQSSDAIAIMVVCSERDPAAFKTDAAQYAAAITDAGYAPVFRITPDHGHLSSILSLGTGDMSLGNDLTAFMQSVAARASA